MHYDFMKFVHHVACFLTALCSINVGAKAFFNKDIYAVAPMLMAHETYINYIFGIAGAVSLVLLVMHSVLCACGSSCSSNCAK